MAIIPPVHLSTCHILVVVKEHGTHLNNFKI